MSAPEAKGSRSDPPGPDGERNLEKIRSLLFGEQVKSFEERIRGLERQMESDRAEMRSLVEKGLGDLAREIRERIDTIARRLDAGEQARSKMEDDLSRRIEREIESIGRSLKAQEGRHQEQSAGISRRLDEVARALETRIEDLGRETLRSLDARQGDLREKIEEMIAGSMAEIRVLREGKADRSALARLLSELGAQIAGTGSDLSKP